MTKTEKFAILGIMGRSLLGTLFLMAEIKIQDIPIEIFNPRKIKTNWREAWEITRERLIIEADGICQWCKQPGENLEVHHRDGCGLNNDIGNLIVVCPPCHGYFHRKNGKKGNLYKKHGSRHGIQDPYVHLLLAMRGKGS